MIMSSASIEGIFEQYGQMQYPPVGANEAVQLLRNRAVILLGEETPDDIGMWDLLDHLSKVGLFGFYVK
jgi:hypothetical protein